MAEHRAPNREPGPLFIEYRFKKRLPPAPTLQADYWLRCYEKLGGMARGREQIVGSQLAASKGSFEFQVSSFKFRVSRLLGTGVNQTAPATTRNWELEVLSSGPS